MPDSVAQTVEPLRPPGGEPALPFAVAADAPPTVIETACFIVATLAISWTLGALWLRFGGEQIVQWLMCTPALVGFACAWIFRREPPRAAGFAFTGWAPWLVGFFYPFAMAVAAITLAYAVRAVTGDPDFIRFQPEAIQVRLLGISRTGIAAVPLRMLRIALLALPWLLVAVAYRQRWPDRLRDALPAPLRFLHHGLRVALFAQVVWFYGTPVVPPGCVGEEMGWRGYLVRRWAARPFAAVALSMPVWAIFHLPVLFAPTQRGHVAQNVFFLASIAAMAVVFAALYLWAGSVWPCALAHLAWNLWNPFLLGDVYGGAPGMFGGAVWVFNGEGVFGFALNGVVALALLWRWRARQGAEPAAVRLATG